MRKLILAAIAVFGIAVGATAQTGFNIGAFIGVPVADGGNYANFSAGLDVAYLFDITDKISVGPATGFTHSFGKDRTYYGSTIGDDFQYIPIAGAGRFNFNEKMAVGLDLGYAIGINDGNDGGVYFKPMFGYNITDKIQLNAAFRGVSLGTARTYNGGVYDSSYYYGGTFSIFSVGAMFNF